MVGTQIEKHTGELSPTQPAPRRRRYAPAVDIIEKPDELLLIADVPGVEADGIDVEFDRGSLTIDAKVKPRYDEAELNFLRHEYGVGDYHRCFEVSEQIDAEKINATVEGGVLTVHLPKAESVKPRKIAVKNA